MIMGWPGAQVICSTGLCRSSHELAEILPSALATGGTRAFTLLAGHNSPDGTKMYMCIGMYKRGQ
jgi:hypothetical protein